MPLTTLYFFIKAAIEKSNLAYRAGAHHQGDGLLALGSIKRPLCPPPLFFQNSLEALNG